MSGFAFDAKAALHQARKCRGVPTLPTLPTDHPAGAEKVGTVGKVGTERATQPNTRQEELDGQIDGDHAACRKFGLGQKRVLAEHEEQAEASCDSKVIRLQQWKDAADDPTDPDVWR